MVKFIVDDVLDDCVATVDELVDVARELDEIEVDWDDCDKLVVVANMLDEFEVAIDDEDSDDCTEVDDSEVVDKLVEDPIVELVVTKVLDDDKTVDVADDVNGDEVVVTDDVRADEVPDERFVTIVAFHPLVGTEERRLDVEVAPTAPASDAWLVVVDVEESARVDEEDVRVDVELVARVDVEVDSTGPMSVASSSGQEVLGNP